MNKTIILLVSSTLAIKLNDAPAAFHEPTWGQSWPSAAGLAQIKDAPPAFNEPTWGQSWPSAAGLAQD